MRLAFEHELHITLLRVVDQDVDLAFEAPERQPPRGPVVVPAVVLVVDHVVVDVVGLHLALERLRVLGVHEDLLGRIIHSLHSRGESAYILVLSVPDAGAIASFLVIGSRITALVYGHARFRIDFFSCFWVNDEIHLAFRFSCGSLWWSQSMRTLFSHIFRRLLHRLLILLFLLFSAVAPAPVTPEEPASVCSLFSPLLSPLALHYIRVIRPAPWIGELYRIQARVCGRVHVIQVQVERPAESHKRLFPRRFQIDVEFLISPDLPRLFSSGDTAGRDRLSSYRVARFRRFDPAHS